MKAQPTFFRDKTGKIVIIQFPNWVLWSVFVLSLMQYVSNPSIRLICFWLSKILLSYWSYLEIRYGVDGFRKTLGFAAMLYILYGIFVV